MPTTTKLDAYRDLAHRTAERLAGHSQEWLRFLDTAARLYKYPYPEQLLIHAQRPQAIACADYDTWKIRMGRYVRRGAAGIALVRRSRNGDPVLRYVFDVADTGTGQNARCPFLWKYCPEYAGAVAAALEKRFEVPGGNSLTEQLDKAAVQLVNTYWLDFANDIQISMRGSQMGDYDEDNVSLRFRNAAIASVSYVLLTRCGIDVKDVFTDEDFQCIGEFDSAEAISTLGTAVSVLTEDVLRTVENAIRTFEREKLDAGAAAPGPESGGPAPASEAENAPPPAAEPAATGDARPKRAPRKRKAKPKTA